MNYCVINSCGSVPSECFRTFILSLLFLLTFIGCVIQVIRIIKNTKQWISYHTIVLYLILVETIFGIAHWFILPSTTMLFWIMFFKEIELCVITYFFIHSAFLSFGKRSIAKFLWPVFTLIVIFYFVITVLASLGITEDILDIDSTNECIDPTFIILSSTGLFLTLTFFVTGIIITKKMNETISKNLLKKKKLELWALIFVYFVISLTSFLVDLFDIIKSISLNSCYALFEQTSWPDAFLTLFEHTFDLLLPIWAIIIVFEIEARREKGKSNRSLLTKGSGQFFQNFDDEDTTSPDDYKPSSSYYSVAS